jgi:hypothetical protein
MHLFDADIGLLFLALCFAYVFPALVGLLRRRSNLDRIVLVNFLLGWTVIGWLVALAWAVEEEQGKQERGR